MGKKLSDKQLSDLITKGKTTIIKGLLSPGSDNKINGKFSFDEQFNVDFIEG
jgi:DNA topoisomerase III